MAEGLWLRGSGWGAPRALRCRRSGPTALPSPLAQLFPARVPPRPVPALSRVPVAPRTAPWRRRAAANSPWREGCPRPRGPVEGSGHGSAALPGAAKMYLGSGRSTARGRPGRGGGGGPAGGASPRAQSGRPGRPRAASGAVAVRGDACGPSATSLFPSRRRGTARPRTRGWARREMSVCAELLAAGCTGVGGGGKLRLLEIFSTRVSFRTLSGVTVGCYHLRFVRSLLAELRITCC